METSLDLVVTEMLSSLMCIGSFLLNIVINVSTPLKGGLSLAQYLRLDLGGNGHKLARSPFGIKALSSRMKTNRARLWRMR
jgi:hypothetical protein